MKQTIFALVLTLVLLSPILLVFGSFIRYEWGLYRARKKSLANCDVTAYCDRLSDIIKKIDESHENGYGDSTLELFVKIFGEDYLKGLLQRHLTESKKKSKAI